MAAPYQWGLETPYGDGTTAQETVILVGDAADDLKFTERLYDRLLGSAPTRDKLLAAVTEEKPRRGKMLDDLTSAIGVPVLHAPCFSVKSSPSPADGGEAVRHLPRPYRPPS